MSQIIEHEKLKLVSGLDWHPIDVKRKNIQKLSKEFNSPFYATFGRKREGVQEQVGLYQGTELLKRNHLSLVVLVLSQLEDTDAVVVIQLGEEIYAMVVIDNGLITHDLSGTKEEVQKQFLNLAAYKDFNVKYAPEGWSSSDTTEFVLDVFLAKKNKEKARIKPVNIKLHKVLIPIILVVASFYAFNQWLDYQEKQKKAALLAESQRLKALNNKKAQQVVYPWNKSTSALMTWNACESLFMPLDLYPAGWKYKAIGCNASGLTISFNRHNGNVSGLIKTYPNADVDLSGDSAVINMAHSPKLPKIQVPIASLPGLTETKNRLLSLSQDYQFGLELTPMVSKSLPGQKQNNQKPFKQFKVTVNSELIPVNNVLELINLPTLVATTFSSTELGSWQIQGVLYVK